MEDTVMTLPDFAETLRRRKWSLILPALFIFLMAAVIALVLPPIYQSTATILVEEQEIPAEFVTTTVTSYVEQRVQTINQRIMSYTRLLDIINQFNLYPDRRNRFTVEEIVTKMREDIHFEPISVEVIDRRTGRPTAATIAFTLSYEGKHAETVQKVTSVLASLFLRENLEVRERQTLETTEFIGDEMKKVQADLAKLDAKIAEFKEKHMNELPSLLQANFQNLHYTESSIERLSEQLRGLKERKEYLETELAGIPRYLEQEKKKRLEQLKIELAHLQSRFSDEYPDVIKVKAEIAKMERELGAGDDPMGMTHDQPDNPAYITLASQLAGVQADTDAIIRQIKDLEIRANEYRRRIGATPRVEEEYKTLIVEQESTQTKYEDLMRKLMEARVAHGLEKDQKGERFTLIEPARLPEKPVKPNRLVILLIGLVLGIGAGGGTAYLRETTDQTVYTAKSLAKATGSSVLVGIPEIKTKRDIVRGRIKKMSLATGLLLCVVAGLVVFHYFVMDLNVFWAKVLRRMTL